MRMHSVTRFCSVTLVSVLFGALPVSFPTPAEGVGEVAYGRTLTDTQVAAVSETGTEILAEVAKARAAISRGDGTEARENVGRARALLGEVRAMSPAVRFEHEVGKVLGKIANQKAGADDLLPVYAELDVLQDPEKAAEIRGHLDRAKGHLEVLATPRGARRPVTAPPLDADAMRQQWRSASEELIEACSKMSYMEIDLPIHETYALLRRAQIGLLHNDLPAADASLAEVQKKVEIFVEIASGTEKEVP